MSVSISAISSPIKRIIVQKETRGRSVRGQAIADSPTSRAIMPMPAQQSLITTYLLKSFDTSQGQLSIYWTHQRGLQVSLESLNGIIQIDPSNIFGVPASIQDPAKLTQYLKRVFVVMNASSDGGYKVTLIPKMVGGGVAGGLGPELLQLIQNGMTEARKSTGKDLVVLVGATGTGKSTAINYLLGKTMMMAQEQIGPKKRNVIKVDGTALSEIGHNPVNSQTLYSSVFDDPSSNVSFCDCGGFLDSRGTEHDISVSVSMKLTLNSARSARIVLCSALAPILEDRGSAFRQTVSLVLKRLYANFEHFPRSLMLLITKPQYGADVYTTQEVRDHIRTMASNPAVADRHLFEFLSRENGRFIHVCDPLDVDAKNALKSAMIQDLEPITNTLDAFNVAYSSDAKLKISEELIGIATEGTTLYVAHEHAKENERRLTADQQRLSDSIHKLDTDLKALADKVGSGASPEEIQVAQAQLVKRYQDKASELESAIAALNTQRSQQTAQMESMRTQMSAHDAQEEALYWEDSVNKSAQFDTKYEVTQTEREEKTEGHHWGFFSPLTGECFYGGYKEGESKTVIDKDVTERQVGVSITREFNYRGIAMTRVEKHCESGEWSNENLDRERGSYLVTYTSSPGAEGRATVRVFAKKCDFPNEINKKTALLGQLMTRQQTGSQLELDAMRKQFELSEAKRLIESSGDIRAQLDSFRQNLAQLNDQKAKVEGELQAARQSLADISQKLSEKAPRFDFLKSFLLLSKDRVLTQVDVVADFLQRNTSFSRESA